jgi:hypothetical protein
VFVRVHSSQSRSTRNHIHDLGHIRGLLAQTFQGDARKYRPDTPPRLAGAQSEASYRHNGRPSVSTASDLHIPNPLHDLHGTICIARNAWVRNAFITYPWALPDVAIHDLSALLTQSTGAIHERDPTRIAHRRLLPLAHPRPRCAPVPCQRPTRNSGHRIPSHTLSTLHLTLTTLQTSRDLPRLPLFTRPAPQYPRRMHRPCNRCIHRSTLQTWDTGPRRLRPLASRVTWCGIRA